MENRKKTAGETAKTDSLTESQKERLIAKMTDLSIAKRVFVNTTDAGSPRRVITFHNGITTSAAITTDPEIKCYVDKDGCDVKALCDPEFFEYVEKYFINKMNVLLEEIYSIYQEGGEE